MNDIKCPHCGKKQTKNPVKNWKYSGGVIDVKRFECGCGKFFNFYTSPKKTWTIPKPK